LKTTPSITDNFFEAVGTPVVDVARAWGALLGCGLRTLRAIVVAPIAWREVIHQGYLIGNRSVPFITVTLGFLGLISVYQVALQIQQIIPDFSMLGAAFLQMMIREFAPTITGS
jgi:phospholipid/cholesterol/gamma-HCH transport system permease protein